MKISIYAPYAEERFEKARQHPILHPVRNVGNSEPSRNGFEEVGWISTGKSASVELSKFLDSVGVLRPGVPQMSGCVLLNLKSERVAAELFRTLDDEKMVDERGFEPPASSLRTGNH
jgi:hypothetical protein